MKLSITIEHDNMYTVTHLPINKYALEEFVIDGVIPAGALDHTVAGIVMQKQINPRTITDVQIGVIA